MQEEVRESNFGPSNKVILRRDGDVGLLPPLIRPSDAFGRAVQHLGRASKHSLRVDRVVQMVYTVLTSNDRPVPCVARVALLHTQQTPPNLQNKDAHRTKTHTE